MKWTYKTQFCNFLSSKEQNTVPKKKAEKKRYCEICLVSFTNLSLHVNSLEHVKFCSDPQNYKALDELIDSFPLPTTDVSIVNCENRDLLIILILY